MGLIWLPALLTCIGGAIACMTNNQCTSFHTDAVTALSANDLTEYCRLRSRSIACYAADTTNCTNPDLLLDTMYTGYYNTCSLTAADVERCQVNTASCSSLLTDAVTALSTMNFTVYCSAMELYLTCVNDTMAFCNDSVTIYDVLGSVHGSYDMYCSSGSGWAILQMCQAKTYRCYPHLSAAANSTGNPAALCSAMEDYLNCVNQTMSTCDPSLTLTDVVGPMVSSYITMCGTGGIGSCPAASTCLQPLMSRSFQPIGQPQSNPLLNCSMIEGAMRCMDRELAACDLTSPRSYTFANISGLYVTVCQSLVNNTSLLTCSQMGSCIITMKFPTDLAEVTRQLYDPQFWCSLLKSTMTCAGSADQCQSDRSEYTALLGRVNQVCPEAPLLMNISGTGNQTTPSTTESPLQMCQTKIASCSSTFAASNTQLSNLTAVCSITEDFISCLKPTMRICDTYLPLSDTIRQLETNYSITCGAEGIGSCPAASTCLQPLMSRSFQPIGQPQSNPLLNCSMIEGTMRCMDRELAACNLTSPRSYTFANISGLYVTVCQSLVNNTSLLTCSQMGSCIITMKFPTDLAEVTRQLYDPQFWCSLLKSTMTCAGSADQCQSDRSEYTALLGRVNQVCPEAPLLVNISGTGNQTTPSTTESPLQMCQTKIASCSSIFAASNTQLSNLTAVCSITEDFISCLKPTMRICDTYLPLSDTIRQLETNYSITCGAEGAGSCPATATCLMPLMSTSQSMTTPSTAIPRLSTLLNCSLAEGFGKCMATALTSCNVTSPRSYTFADISGLLVTVCESLANNNLLTCSQMGSCMNTMKIPTDLAQFYDPEVWCSLLKSTMACASSADKCTADRSEYTAILNGVNQVCPGAPLLVNVTIRNDQTTSTVTTKVEMTTSKDQGVDHGPVHRAGLLTVLSVASVVLLSRHL